MKLVIAGSRDFKLNKFDIQTYISFFDLWPKVIISGGCRTGADKAAFWYAVDKNKDLSFKFEEIPAEWVKYGKAAGPIRNKKMAELGDALLLIWNGTSKGSKNMKEENQ